MYPVCCHTRKEAASNRGENPTCILYRRTRVFVSVRTQLLLGIITRCCEERASYNGNIEASQASDVGSIPIARSRF